MLRCRRAGHGDFYDSTGHHALQITRVIASISLSGLFQFSWLDFIMRLALSASPFCPGKVPP